MQTLKKTIQIILLLLMMLSIPMTVVNAEVSNGTDDETDLQISVETITQRGYSGMAATDKYEIEILTPESYEKAKKIAAKQEQAYIAIQTSLFETSSNVKNADSVSAAAEQLGLFDNNYTLTSTKSTQNTAEGNMFLIVCLLALSAGAGIVLAIVLQKRKGGQRE